MPVARRLKVSSLAVLALLAALPAGATETVKIAFIDVLSGPFARAGEGSLAQLREVVSQINAKAAAGDPKFEIVPFDGKGTPQESITVLKAATDQGHPLHHPGRRLGCGVCAERGGEQAGRA